MARKSLAPALSMAFVLALSLSACGGGSSGGATPVADNPSTDPSPNPTPDPNPDPSPPPTPDPQLRVTRLNLAQTHVIPEQGKRWSQQNGDGEPRDEMELHLTGERPTLALFDVTPDSVSGMRVEGRLNGVSLGNVELLANSELPPSESEGPRFSESARVVDLPAGWMKPGLQLRVSAPNAVPSAWRSLNVGAPADFLIRALPMYLFGADETLVSAKDAMPTQAQLDEMYAKWPVTTIDVPIHPAGKIQWPQLVVPPRGGNAAYVMNSHDDRNAGFDPIAAARSIYGSMRVSGGESQTAVQYYASLIFADANGNFSSVGGGLGGGHVGGGDHLYRGIYIHEQGHAFGLPHAGESFDGNNGGIYPYPGGSLSGSNWSFDEPRRLFQPTLVPANASRFDNCRSNTFGGSPRQVDDQGRCIRQDPMQSGSGDQAAGDSYSTFADYHAGRIQRYFEGLASDNEQNERRYSGGRVFESNQSTTGYRRWDSIDLDWVEVDDTVTSQNGIFGVRENYPVQKAVPVYTIALTISYANTPGVTQIYPVVGPYTGNLITNYDPTVADDRADITINTGTHAWYCRHTGCDYTVKVTYANGTERHVVLPRAFRPFFANGDTPQAEAASDPTDSKSFLLQTINVPADSTITRVELLDTPKAWEGLPDSPAVLASRNVAP